MELGDLRSPSDFDWLDVSEYFYPLSSEFLVVLCLSVRDFVILISIHVLYITAFMLSKGSLLYFFSILR